MSVRLAPVSDGEARRLESLDRLHVLGAAPESVLDDVAGLAGRLLGAPYAAVVFVDGVRAWSQAVPGAGPRGSMPRRCSPAHLAIGAPEGLIVERADHGDLADHPAADGPAAIRRFAAAVITAPDGQRVGALEVGWPDLRSLDERDRETLQRVAGHAGRLLELRSEADEYRRFIELSPDAVTVLDLDGCIELANPALAHLLGAEDDAELRGRSFLDLVAAADRTWVAAELARVLFSRRHSSRLDLGLVRLDGRLVRCSVNAGHLRSSRRSLQLVIRDLDERIRAEEERARLSEQLAQAQRLDLAGRLASGLAHDLKNLVTVMMANLTMAETSIRELVTDDVDPAHALEDLEQVRIAVDRAGVLTTKLMQFARQEPADDEQVDVAEAVEAIRRLVETSLGKGVRLVVDLDEDLPPIVADRVQLEQALVNLVMNSSDACTEAGTIRIRAHRYEPTSADAHAVRTRTALDPTRDYVSLVVSDDGAGMDDETITRAFEPLFSTKGAARGTGLGLPTVMAFAQQVDGEVRLDSRPGQGTRATLVLPTSPAAVPALLDRHHPVAGAKVVLADPNERARRVIAQMLRSAGYRVRTVSSGEDALQALRADPADVLVTELSLPGMPGWRTVERAREEFPGLAAMIFASTEAPSRFDGVATLAKPFSSDRLLRTLGELLATT